MLAARQRLVRRLVAMTLAAAAIALHGCAGAGRRPPVARPAPPLEIVAPPGSVAATALAFRGVPYRPGGADPSGFDCSGLVQYVFAQHGYALPRLAVEQYAFGRSVRPDAVDAGDLLFFATSGRRVSHVGIALGGRLFVHAPNARGVVRVESLDTPYWRNRVVGARRVAADQAAR